MRTRLALLALLVVGIAATLPTPAPAQPPDKAVPLVVPTDCFAFFTVNVGKLYDTPGFKPLRAWFEAQKVGPTDDLFGLPAGEVDRITVFMPAPSLQSPPVVLVTSRKPYNEARVLKALRADQRGDRGGRERARVGNAIPIDSDTFPVVVLVDERTLLFLPNERESALALAGLVGQLLAKKPDGPLAAAVADAAKHDLALGMDVRPMVALFELNQNREAAPYAALLKARTLTLAADFDRTARGALKLTFANDADAKRAAPVLQEAAADLAKEFERQIARDKERKDPAALLFLESLVTVLKAGKVESAGPEVFATAEVPYADAVAKLAAALPKEYIAAVSTSKAENNLKQLALAMHNFDSANGFTPGDVMGGAPNAPAWSWRVQVLPYLEQENLYRLLDFTKSWDAPENLKRLEAMEMPKVFEHPGRPAPKGHTYFRIFTKPKNAKGNERPWLIEGQRGPTFAQITDGTSNTLLIVEAGEAVPWYKPDVFGYDGMLPLPPLGDKAADRFLAAMGDGSVRSFKPSKLGEKTIRALITIQGGEVISLP